MRVAMTVVLLHAVGSIVVRLYFPNNVKVHSYMHTYECLKSPPPLFSPQARVNVISGIVERNAV